MIRFIQVILMTTASRKRNKISLSCRIFLEIYDPLGEKQGELKRDNKLCNKIFGFVL